MIGKKLNQTIFTVILLCFIFCLTLPASALVTNYRSIGTTTGVLYSTAGAFVPAAGTTVFFGPGCSLPLNIGKGDRLLIDDEEFFILRRDSETQVSVQSQAKAEHIDAAFTIERAHHSIGAWEAVRDGDL